MALSRFRVHPGGASLVRRKIKNERLDRRKRWMESEKEIDRGRNKESLGAGALGFLFAHYLLAWMHRPLCCVDYVGSSRGGFMPCHCSLSKAKTDEDDDDEVLGSGSSKFERARLKERGCLRANLAELREITYLNYLRRKKYVGEGIFASNGKHKLDDETTAREYNGESESIKSMIRFFRSDVEVALKFRVLDVGTFLDQQETARSGGRTYFAYPVGQRCPFDVVRG
ncbi:hypothetical protein V1478_013877 [Vespula squamosa]|uniref:Uncharacterized protein n=1 Tax=Vespula squamosa TaxID=30214 RepID=A0ABD2A6H3_VESSQ